MGQRHRPAGRLLTAQARAPVTRLLSVVDSPCRLAKTGWGYRLILKLKFKLRLYYEFSLLCVQSELSFAYKCSTVLTAYQLFRIQYGAHAKALNPNFFPLIIPTIE